MLRAAAVRAIEGMKLPSRPKNQRQGRIQKRYQARRLEILRAAGNEFRAHGFEQTGMREIAAAAGLSPANLYNYFRGKDEILFFCQDNSLDRMIAALEKARRLRTGVGERLRFVIVSHVMCVLDEVEGSAAHLIPTELPAGMQRTLVTKRDRYEDGVRQLIVAGMRGGEFVECDAALATRALLGALNWSVRWFNPEGALTAGAIASGFADYLIRGLLVNRRTARGPASRRGMRTTMGTMIAADTKKHAYEGQR